MSKYDLAPYLTAIEDELRRLLTAREPGTAPLYQMMQYHMGWLDPAFAPEEAARGKRVRPLMCLLACQAAGGEWSRALAAACSIELVHNFSLIHDDIEDRSDTRRHRRTVWSLWGIPQGINTGDTMWVLARLAVFGLLERDYEAATVLRVARLLDETCLELCTGQYLDISFETLETVSLPEYQRMIAGKTAALLSAALASGAILAGGSEAAIAAYSAFGRELGLTFQIVDDLLGIWGDPGVTGKSAASDILAKKKTLPLLYALQWEREHGYDDLKTLYRRPALTAAEVPIVLALLERAGTRAYAQAQAQAHQQQTLAYLQEAVERSPSTPAAHAAQLALRELAHALLDRSS